MLRRWLAAGAAGEAIRADFESNTGIRLDNARVTSTTGLPDATDVARIRQWLAAIDKNSVNLNPNP
jgi:hypothetical protein